MDRFLSLLDLFEHLLLLVFGPLDFLDLLLERLERCIGRF